MTTTHVPDEATKSAARRAKKNGATSKFHEAMAESAKADAPKPREFTEDVLVDLTAEEIAAFANEQAEIHGRRQERDVKKKDLLREFRVLDKPDRLREDECAQAVREKKALRPTVLVEHKVFETGKAVVSVKESGVFVRERALTIDERQSKLPLGEADESDADLFGEEMVP